MAKSLSALSELTGLDDLIADRSDATQHRVGFLRAAKLVGRRFSAHNLTVVAAGIAFFLLLALVPTMAAVVSGYSLTLGTPQEAQAEIIDLVDRIENETTRDFLQEQLEQVVDDTQGKGRLGLIFGILLALFSVSGAMQKLMGSISTAYHVQEKRKGLLMRLMAFVFTALLLFLIAITVIGLGILPALLNEADLGGLAEGAINFSSVVVVILLFTGAMTVMYRYGPNRQHRTPWVNKGALTATTLFALFSIGMVLFFRLAELPPSYGLLGSIAVIMIFLQLVALAIVLGAEVNAVLENPANAKEPPLAVAAPIPVATAGPRLTARGNPVGGSRAAAQAALTESTPFSTDIDAPIDIDIDIDADTHTPPVEEQPKTLSFGKAMAGLVALFALGRASSK